MKILQQRSEKLEKKLPSSKKSSLSCASDGNQEKKLIETVKEKKNQLEQLRFQEEEAERIADYNKVAELRYSKIPALEKEIEEAERTLDEQKERLLQEEVDENLIAHIVSKWTGIPVEKMLEGEAQNCCIWKRSSKIGRWTAFCRQAVCEAIRRSRAGLNDPKGPSECFSS